MDQVIAAATLPDNCSLTEEELQEYADALRAAIEEEEYNIKHLEANENIWAANTKERLRIHANNLARLQTRLEDVETGNFTGVCGNKNCQKPIGLLRLKISLIANHCQSCTTGAKPAKRKT